MRFANKVLTAAFAVALCLPIGISKGFAQESGLSFSELRRAPPAIRIARQPPLYAWMNPEIADAWRQGFRGQRTQITIVDDFTSRNRDWGILGPRPQILRHGEWVRQQAGMIAPSATLASHDFHSDRAVRLGRNQLQIVNLSYGMFAQSGFGSVRWGPQEGSIIAYAHSGAAVIVKAAGNDSVAIGAPNRNGFMDYLNRDLIGAQAAIFVGALDRNGSVSDPARLTWYSNFAGSNLDVQDQFLSVGVRGDLTGLYGTSFAAPIVSGYASVLGSKFTNASPSQIASRLLETARTDTILGYNAAIHGRGEASIARALAPLSIR
jgi:subtilisin family serine protease